MTVGPSTEEDLDGEHCPPAVIPEGALARELPIVNKKGLHARASAKFTQLAAKFKSDVWLTRNGRRINAKSIMGVMMLAAGKGAKVLLEADGPDEEACVAALAGLINDKFGEGE